jgi:transcriptional regulator with XRE-family HTH domain
MPGSIIKQFREFKNYSQEYVAKQMGISQNAYSKIENNITQLTVNHVKQLSKILDIPVVDLLKDDFEIRKPHYLDTEANKHTILVMLNDLQHTVKLKDADKHGLYPVLAALIETAKDISMEIE